MSDRVIERRANQYRDTYPEVAALLDQANALLPEDLKRNRLSPSLEAKDQYKEAMRVFREDPLNRDTIMRLWQTRYDVLGSRVGLTIKVPDLDYYVDEIEGLAHMTLARGLVYVPDELMTTPQGLIYSNRMYPQMRNWVGKPDTDLALITHASNNGGWRHIESGCEMPFTDTTQAQLEANLADLRNGQPSYIWVGQRLITFIVGSQHSKAVWRHYFDETGWVRLLGSFDGGEVLSAYFGSSGKLYFHWYWYPEVHRPDLGGRFEGAKP